MNRIDVAQELATAEAWVDFLKECSGIPLLCGILSLVELQAAHFRRTPPKNPVSRPPDISVER